MTASRDVPNESHSDRHQNVSEIDAACFDGPQTELCVGILEFESHTVASRHAQEILQVGCATGGVDLFAVVARFEHFTSLACELSVN